MMLGLLALFSLFSSMTMYMGTLAASDHPCYPTFAEEWVREQFELKAHISKRKWTQTGWGTGSWLSRQWTFPWSVWGSHSLLALYTSKWQKWSTLFWDQQTKLWTWYL